MTLAIAWASFLIGAIVGAFWAGRRRDDRETYDKNKQNTPSKWKMPTNEEWEKLFDKAEDDCRFMFAKDVYEHENSKNLHKLMICDDASEYDLPRDDAVQRLINRSKSQ